MRDIQSWRRSDGLELVRMRTGRVQVDVAPGKGGHIVSLVHPRSGTEYLGPEGIDELFPGLLSQDARLRAVALEPHVEGVSLFLRGTLPGCGLHYERRISVDEASPQVHMAYHIMNRTDQAVDLSWVLQASIRISPGDRLLCPAQEAMVGGIPAKSTALPSQPADKSVLLEPGAAPSCLWGLEDGWLRVTNAVEGHEFGYRFDHAVFPWVWLRTAGGQDCPLSAVIGPGTVMAGAVARTSKEGSGLRLAPGHSLRTRVVIHAGHARRNERDIAY